MSEIESTDRSATTVVARLAATMADLGMRDMFTLMGAGNLRLIHHLAVDHGIHIHHLRHENGAVGAADGYFRTTGEVGWCTVTQGPGFTNTITAVQTANRAGSAMVFITSDSSAMDERRFPFAGGVQGLDPEVLLAPLGVTVHRMSPNTAEADLRHAHAVAKAESKIVVLVIETGFDLAPTEVAEPVAVTQVAPPRASEEEIQAIVNALVTSFHPVVLAGRGALGPGVSELIEKIAERCGGHLATTARAVGMFPDNPANLGIFGGFSAPEAAEVIEHADLILAFGASLNLFQTRAGHFLEGATVIQVDTDAHAFGRWDQPQVRVHADAGDTAQRVLSSLVELLPSGSRPVVSAPKAPAFDDVSLPGEMDPRTLCLELDRVLPRPRRTFVDNGHFGSFPMSHMRHEGRAPLVWMPDFGAVGSALGASEAGAIADPDVLSVLFIGDCGFYMTMGDFEMAVREKLPMVVICMNDGAAGSELAHMKDWGVPPEQAIFGYSDIAAAARGMGATSALISSVSDVAGAVAAWDPAGGPLFLDCHITRAVRSPIYDHV